MNKIEYIGEVGNTQKHEFKLKEGCYATIQKNDNCYRLEIKGLEEPYFDEEVIIYFNISFTNNGELLINKSLATSRRWLDNEPIYITELGLIYDLLSNFNEVVK